MAPVICSFFTQGSGYEAEAREMERSARAFGLFTDIRPVPDLGDWCANCAQKPAFIRDRLRDYPGRAVVWLDADARVRRRPSLFFDGIAADFAAVWRWGKELLSGTLYFAATPRALELAEAWTREQLRAPDVWDQLVLQQVIESRMVPGLELERLPNSYTAIFDAPDMGREGDWVISHHQASRRLANASRANQSA